MTRKEKLARVGVVLLKVVFAAALSAAIILYLLLIFGQVAVAEAADAAAHPAIDLTELLQAALAVLATLVTGYLIPWLRAKAGKEKQEMLNSWIDVAVYAAQQLYETKPSPTGWTTPPAGWRATTLSWIAPRSRPA